LKGVEVKPGGFEKIKSMTFNQMVNAMSDAGIEYHQYCAMD